MSPPQHDVTHPAPRHDVTDRKTRNPYKYPPQVIICSLHIRTEGQTDVTFLYHTQSCMTHGFVLRMFNMTGWQQPDSNLAWRITLSCPIFSMAGVLPYVHDQSRTCPYKVNPPMEMKNGRKQERAPFLSRINPQIINSTNGTKSCKHQLTFGFNWNHTIRLFFLSLLSTRMIRLQLYRLFLI